MLLKFLRQFNIVRGCREDFNVSVWKCPTFLFVLMGVAVTVSTLTAYFIASRFDQDPQISALLALGTAGIVLIIGHIIIQSFAKIVEVSRLKSQFLDIISHQLLTPLTALKWSASTIESDGTSPESAKQQEAYMIIKESTNKMVNIVNTLLDIARIEAGRVTMNFGRFDMRESVKKIIALRAHDLEAKHSTIELWGEEVIAPVLADPFRTRLVIENLVDNAIKYSREHSSIVITLRQENDRVMFEIKDKGVGIPAHEHKNIFQKFFRASNEFSYQTKGLGVGLYLVKFIIEASGGAIGFESQEGVGSRFWFSLPVYKYKT
ncbi:HAMP domain-containing histidine kinase [Candidatus Azambacteria bacterium]|nr:HAMP domain-containing histidine kinase [Candidatus Azambacteria bacterium]